MSKVRDVFDELWETRGTASPAGWYGLKVIVQPDGKSTIEFNYDRDCALDDTFFDS